MMTLRPPRAALWLALATAAACGDATGPTDELVHNRRLWLGQYIADYTYEFERWCYCPLEWSQPVRLTVHDGAVITAEVIATGQALTPAEIAQRRYQPVDELFTVILDAIARGVADLDVDYHPTLGYPRRVAIDYDERMVDDEILYRALNLTDLRTP